MGTDPESTSLAEANLTVEDGAKLLALADGLCQIGRIREGRDAGQFAVFNFLLRAAYEEERVESDRRGKPLVVLMRAGVFRRHTWFTRVYWSTGEEAARVEVPSPIDAGWTWQPDIDEIRRRLVEQGGWREAVKEPFEERVTAVAAELRGAEVVRIDARDERRRPGPGS